MIDYQRLFHVGIRVPDLGRAMSEMGASLGLTWAEVRDSSAQSVWTPERGNRTVALRYVYSCDGPQHVELLEGEAGSVWDGRDPPGLHHLGVWVDDIADEIDRLVNAGWRVVACQRSPDDGYGVFAYVAPTSGTIVELVDASLAPGFERWWADGRSTVR